MQKKERYSKIIEWFKENMPAAESELHHRNAYELIVAVILSAQCTDKRVNMVTPALFEAYPDAQSLANASVEDILRHIKSISYPNSKAAHLSGMAKKLISDFGGEVPDDVTLLQTLPGVGRKTANVVAAVMYGKSVMPVDTHVFRVSERIEFTTNSKTPLATESPAARPRNAKTH
jgi:endonuclease-3